MVPLKYNLRSILVRRNTSLATAFGVALVVFLLSSLLMIAAGLKRTLTLSGNPGVALVIRKGSEAELTSVIDSSQVPLVLAPAQVARRADGAPDGVSEVVVVVTADKQGGDGVANVQVRGVTDDVWTFRPEVAIVEGRRPRPGADECVIGSAIRGRFKGLDLGQSIELKKDRPLRVVGVMSAKGASFESEVWSDLDVVRGSFGREGYVQSVRVRLTDATAFAAYKTSVERNHQLSLQVLRESEFYERQSESASAFILGMGGLIAACFAMGATMGAAITMYAAVANRRREIGTLRALGFGKGSIMLSFLSEAMLLAGVGGAAGALASYFMGFVQFSVLNFQSWSMMVFHFEATPNIVLGSVAFAVLMGVVGGFLPALRAAHLPLVHALKD